MKKIVLIGPVFPYKGGISHFTGLMCRSLQKKYDVSMVSYKYQYPGLLFKKEQKDFENDRFKIDDAKFWIHTVNPANWIRTAGRINKWKPDLVIIQWWHPYFAPCYYILSKLLESPRLFVCHNVFPHERFPLDRWLTRKVLRSGSGFIVQSGTDEKDLLTLVSDAVYERTVHPTYDAFQFEGLSRESARALLEFHGEEQLLLFFGFIREYKGLKHLIKALPIIAASLQSVKLMIVGDFDQDKEQYLTLINQCGMENLIYIRDGYIPDREVERYFMACDLVVLPYESATQSGIVQMAYGFERPVVVTDVGGLPDVVTHGATGYVVPPHNPEALAEAVVRYFSENKQKEFQDHIAGEKEKYSWNRLTASVEAVYNRLPRES